MRNTFGMLFGFVVALAMGCSTFDEPPDVLEQTPWLLGEWHRAEPDYPKQERFWIDAGAKHPNTSVQRTYGEERFRQVGWEGDTTLPYPTACRFIRHSTDFSVTEEAPHLHVSYRVSAIELVEDKDNDPACVEFIRRQQSLIDEGGLRYAFKLQQDGNDVVTSDGTRFTRR